MPREAKLGMIYKRCCTCPYAMLCVKVSSKHTEFHSRYGSQAQECVAQREGETLVRTGADSAQRLNRRTVLASKKQSQIKQSVTRCLRAQCNEESQLSLTFMQARLNFPEGYAHQHLASQVWLFSLYVHELLHATEEYRQDVTEEHIPNRRCQQPLLCSDLGTCSGP